MFNFTFMLFVVSVKIKSYVIYVVMFFKIWANRGLFLFIFLFQLQFQQYKFKTA